MKHKNGSPNSNQKRAGASRSAPAGVNQKQVDFAPAVDDVARRAYFSYENQGSQHGQDVQHWLTAETELSAERRLV
jgi:TRAP-type uncharacterized transport system substrate-binding protein